MQPWSTVAHKVAEGENWKMPYATFQEYWLLAVMVLWLGGGVVLGSRFRKKREEYLKHFPPVYEDLPLYRITTGRTPFGAESRAIWHAMFDRQSNTTLEHLRREVLRRRFYHLAWIFVCPAVCFGMFALLVLSGVAH